MKIPRWYGLAMLALAGGCSGVSEGPETRPMGRPVLSAAELEKTKTEVRFVKHVKPILEARCVHCHSGEKPGADFSLESRRGALSSGPRGPRILPGDPDHSLLIVVVGTGNHGLTMPAVGMRMPEEEIEVLRRWISQGAAWPDGAAGHLRTPQ